MTPNIQKTVEFINLTIAQMIDSDPELTDEDIENCRIEFADKILRRTGLSIHAELGLTGS